MSAPRGSPRGEEAPDEAMPPTEPPRDRSQPPGRAYPSRQGRKQARRIRRILGWTILPVLGVMAVVIGVYLTEGSGPLFAASFPQAKTLMTNERAYSSPHAPGVRISPDWIVTSGSLFSVNGAGWTGIPDGVAPNVSSSNGNDSAVFRVVTRRADFLNVTVSFQLKVVELVSTQRTPAVAYDGVHVFLRYQNPQDLYVVSVFRRDSMVAIKRKVPGGPANGGSYSTLASLPYRTPMQTWVPVSVTIDTLSGNATRIALDIEAQPVLSVIDHGSPLTAGRVGLRGDNCEFYIRDFTVSSA